MINPHYVPKFFFVKENNIEYKVYTDTDIYTEKWYRKDNLYLSRELGPAITFNNGSQYWWYNNKRIECSSQEEFDKILKLKAFW